MERAATTYRINQTLKIRAKKTNALSAPVPLTPLVCQSMAIYLELYTNTDNKLHAVQRVFLSHLLYFLG